MKKIIKIVLVFLLVIIASGCDKNINEYEDKYDELNNKVIALENKLKDYEDNQKKLDDLKKENSNLKDEISNLKGEIKSTKNKLNDYSDLKNKYNQLNTKYEKLNKKTVEIDDKDSSGDLYTVMLHTDLGYISYTKKEYYMVSNNGRTTRGYSYGNYDFTVKNGEKYGESFSITSYGYTSGTGFPIVTSYLQSNRRYVIDNDNNRISKFIGWFTEPNGKGKQVKWDTIVDLNSNITLYAYYETIKCYTINYVYQYVGSDTHGTDIINLDINSDLYSNISNIFNNHDIEGIYLDQAMNNRISSNYKIDKDLNIYIKLNN